MNATELSVAARGVIAGLLAPDNENVDGEQICARPEVWEELREEFQLGDFWTAVHMGAIDYDGERP